MPIILAYFWRILTVNKSYFGHVSPFLTYILVFFGPFLVLPFFDLVNFWLIFGLAYYFRLFLTYFGPFNFFWSSFGLGLTQFWFSIFLDWPTFNQFLACPIIFAYCDHFSFTLAYFWFDLSVCLFSPFLEICQFSVFSWTVPIISVTYEADETKAWFATMIFPIFLFWELNLFWNLFQKVSKGRLVVKLWRSSINSTTPYVTVLLNANSHIEQ